MRLSHQFPGVGTVSATLRHRLLQTSFILLLLPPAAHAFSNFITRHGDTLFNGDSVLRFISFNVPNLHLIEDDFTFTDTNNWTLPTSFEIRDAFRSVQQAGGTVIRIYCLRIQKRDEPETGPKHITALRTYSEDALRVMDTVLALANEYGIRLIVPFLEGPPWWGPKTGFARMRHQSFDSRDVRDDFRHLVTTLLNRCNTVTGVRYRDDRAILCWETGNEMSTSASWLSEMAACIRKTDPNHLLMDGNYGVRKCALENPDIDIVSNHFYKTPTCIINHDLRLIRGRKAYIIGEWGWSLARARSIISLTKNNRAISGALIWSLRFHYRTGGYTWHKGEGLHWPGGFYRAELDSEQEISRALREGAFTIRSLPVPPFPVPAPPELAPHTQPPLLSWKGSAGANRYMIERADEPGGPWHCIAYSIDETRTPYRPLFCDTTAPVGDTCYYRVTACGPGGCSEPSASSPPTFIPYRIFVDEFFAGEKRCAASAAVKEATETPWRFKYDFDRVRGHKGSTLDYRIDGTACMVRLYGFMKKAAPPLSLLVSPDGATYRPAAVAVQRYPYCCADPKDHLRLPVLAEADTLPEGTRFIRIRFENSLQLGRCEIGYR